MKKNVVSLLCAAALICGVFCSMPGTGISTFAAEIANSGTCGENLTWKLDDEGTLTISGEGDMTAYSTAATRYEVSPFERSDAIRKVVILDGVTSIASFAFLNCSNLTAVSLPDSLVSIGGDAFAGCTEFTKIDLPKNLNSIGRYVFTCSGLTEITIPSSVTEIGAGAFSDCKSLTNINVSADNQAYASQDGVLGNTI